MVSNPIEGYDKFTVGEVEDALSQYENGLDALDEQTLLDRRDTVEDILEYEEANKDRVTATEAIEEILDKIDERLQDPPVSSEDDADSGSDGDVDNDDDGEELDSEEDEESVEEDDDGQDESDDVDESQDSLDDAAFSGADGSTRVLVRNPNKDSRRIAGVGLEGGEVKDVVLNDRVRSALERGRLQFVSDT